MSRLIYLTGPARGGKSRHAVKLAGAWGAGVVFVATYRAGAGDPEMAERVRRHRSERPEWRTLESPDDIGAALALLQPPPSGVIIDCLTLWLGDRIAQADEAIIGAWDGVLARLLASPWPVIVVGNELGWGPVPETEELRRFRDLAGTLGQRTAAAADEAWLVVAGCPVCLK
jgi:adenosyl cobinamide kinase/adenosyl cobinamide phosphate guanylyltransferase